MPIYACVGFIAGMYKLAEAKADWKYAGRSTS
jgi:hypothetical protein